MRALADLGHEISLITRRPAAPEALAGVPIAYLRSVPIADQPDANGSPLHLTGLQESFRSYWGIDESYIRAVGRLAAECRAEVVVAVGLSVLPCLAAVRNACCVWYAADEYSWHHLSLVRAADRRSWGNVREALVMGLYERTYGQLLQRIWVVTAIDRRLMRWVTGHRAIDVIPNGVDAAYYHPTTRPQENHTCTFWGRLDFGPNIQGLEWFCTRVWPLVRRKAPDARFTIYGFNATREVTRLAGKDGIAVIPDLPDLRAEVARHQVVVLPFVSGSGIKNKLLEAASMGLPILCTSRACGGLRLQRQRPLIVADGPGQWTHRLLMLWNNPLLRQRLGYEVRKWVMTHHSWQTAARAAVASLEQTFRESRP
jgi:glycosyltransferase involved in cell wall biosynthesis